MGGYKEAGSFLYSYRRDGTIVVAYRGIISFTAGQQLVRKALYNVAKNTGAFCDVLYDGNQYIGLIYENIPEKQLVSALTQESTH